MMQPVLFGTIWFQLALTSIGRPMNRCSLSFVLPCAYDAGARNTIELREKFTTEQGIGFQINVSGGAEASWLTGRTMLVRVDPPAKGSCVTHGVLASSGGKIVVCDADLPSKLMS